MLKVFSVLVELDAKERAAYEAGRHGYLDRLAHDIHYIAPGVRGSRSPHQVRDLTVDPGDQSRRADAAIKAWRFDQGAW